MSAFGAMSWPLLVLGVLSMATRGLSNEVVYGDEVSASDDVGFWVVYDTSASRLSDENKAKTDQDHPSCLLLKMKVVVSQGNDTIVDVPMTAQISNDTCYLPEEDHHNDEGYVDYTFTPQSAQLSWIDSNGSSSSLVMTFKSGPPSQDNQGYEDWFWLSKLSIRTQIVKLDIRDMHAFAAPLLFAFRCKSQTMSLSSIAEVKGKPENVTVTFHHLEVEPFRENRYYESLTHLKWDCHNGWPYSFVPGVLLSVVMVLAIVMITDMYLSHRRWRRNNSSQEATENLVAESEDSFANSSDS